MGRGLHRTRSQSRTTMRDQHTQPAGPAICTHQRRPLPAPRRPCESRSTCRQYQKQYQTRSEPGGRAAREHRGGAAGSRQHVRGSGAPAGAGRASCWAVTCQVSSFRGRLPRQVAQPASTAPSGLRQRQQTGAGGTGRCTCGAAGQTSSSNAQPSGNKGPHHSFPPAQPAPPGCCCAPLCSPRFEAVLSSQLGLQPDLLPRGLRHLLAGAAAHGGCCPGLPAVAWGQRTGRGAALKQRRWSGGAAPLGAAGPRPASGAVWGNSEARAPLRGLPDPRSSPGWSARRKQSGEASWRPACVTCKLYPYLATAQVERRGLAGLQAHDTRRRGSLQRLPGAPSKPPTPAATQIGATLIRLLPPPPPRGRRSLPCQPPTVPLQQEGFGRMHPDWPPGDCDAVECDCWAAGIASGSSSHRRPLRSL